MKPKSAELELGRDEIIAAAVAIFRESGLDAVSMRRVSSRLGVSPIPLYSRVGNKEALVEAIADRVLGHPAPAPRPDEDWAAYATRWARALRDRLHRARDSRLIVPPDRTAYIEASRPLVEVMRRDGMAADAAVQACRLVMWATVGFGAVETGVQPPTKRRKDGRLGGDPGGAEPAEVDALFDLHIRYLIDGIRRDLDDRTARPAPDRRATKRPRP